MSHMAFGILWFSPRKAVCFFASLRAGHEQMVEDLGSHLKWKENTKTDVRTASWQEGKEIPTLTFS